MEVDVKKENAISENWILIIASLVMVGIVSIVSMVL